MNEFIAAHPELCAGREKMVEALLNPKIVNQFAVMANAVGVPGGFNLKPHDRMEGLLQLLPNLQEDKKARFKESMLRKADVFGVVEADIDAFLNPPQPEKKRAGRPPKQAATTTAAQSDDTNSSSPEQVTVPFKLETLEMSLAALHKDLAEGDTRIMARFSAIEAVLLSMVRASIDHPNVDAEDWDDLVSKVTPGN